MYEGASLGKFLCDEFPIGTDKKILDWLEKRKGMFVFLGSPGIGKTQLCASFYELIEGKFSWRYYCESEFFGKLKKGMSEGWDSSQHAENMLDDFFIMYDDLGSASSSEWSNEIIFHIINYRSDLNYPTVITSNLTSQQIFDKYGQRTYDRLFHKDNLIFQFHDLPSRRTGNSYLPKVETKGKP